MFDGLVESCLVSSKLTFFLLSGSSLSPLFFNLLLTAFAFALAALALAATVLDLAMVELVTGESKL